MSASRIVLMRRIKPSLTHLTTQDSGLCARTLWWWLGREKRRSSSLADGSFDGIEESGRKPKGPSPRWKELPPVPLESAVFALEEIEETRGREPEDTRGRIKRLTALRWVAKCCPDLPNSLINKLFRLRKIRMRSPVKGFSRDNVALDSDTRLCRVSGKETLAEGSVLCIPAAVLQRPDSENSRKQNPEPTAEEIKWMRSLVLHKDEEVVVINKPVGLAVQGHELPTDNNHVYSGGALLAPGERGGSEVRRSLDSMMGAALTYDRNEGPRLVHRLDKETSGAMVVGRTLQSTIFLQALLRGKTVEMSRASKNEGGRMERRYWALVVGNPEPLKGRISAPLSKVVTDNGKLEKMRVVHKDHPTAQEAITDYEVLGPSVLGCTWLELRPLTGRKHQIRVHCAEALGMPIVGDYKYGWRAFRDWPPDSKEDCEIFALSNRRELGLKGHVNSSTPLLHLHCRQLILPNVAAVFASQIDNQATTLYDRATTDGSNVTSSVLDIIAPLPPHMVASWTLKPVSSITLGTLVSD